MAESHGTEGGHPVMDYAEHEKTYEGFIRFSILGSILVRDDRRALAIGGPGKSWAGRRSWSFSPRSPRRLASS